MKITMRVKPRSGRSKIEEENGTYRAYLRAAPEGGKANIELLKLARKYFKKPVRIVSGFTSKTKIIETF
ncbi:MAG TPA: DUF167 domain-containing protein [Candidatus Nanoarchaeia archaeon]|nr:DUF167 domain-containing protein [Candidatus Nanoarchaeia archaeon]